MREMVIVDHTLLFDGLWSGMTSLRSFLRMSHRVVTIVGSLAVGMRHGLNVWVVCCGVGSEGCGMEFWPPPHLLLIPFLLLHWQCPFIASVCNHCGATMVACVAWLQLLCSIVGAVTFSCSWFPWTAYCSSSESDTYLTKCGYLDCEFPFGATIP